jgi:hypothetical protein
MAILHDHVVLCTESIKDKSERDNLLREICDPAVSDHPREVIDISYKEMSDMCGNMIMLQNKRGVLCTIMSERARKGLSP